MNFTLLQSYLYSTSPMAVYLFSCAAESGRVADNGLYTLAPSLFLFLMVLRTETTKALLQLSRFARSFSQRVSCDIHM